MALRPSVFWSYLRWSAPPQGWGDSESRQIEPGKAWAQARGIEFIDDYRDAGVSAWKGKNLSKGALGQFIRDLEKRDPELPQPGDYLGVESLDRLSRTEHTLDAAELVNTLLKKGIRLILHGMRDLEINREIIREQPWLVDMLIREFPRGSSESTWKSERVRSAKQKLRNRGRETGAPITGESCPGWLVLYQILMGRTYSPHYPHLGPPPSRGRERAVKRLPLDGRGDERSTAVQLKSSDQRDLVLVGADKRMREPGHYELHPANSKTIRLIFEWASIGYGAAVIAGKLNQAGIPTFRKTGPNMRKRIANGQEPKWHPLVVREYLANRSVIGYVQPYKHIEGKKIPDGPELKLYPAVIDETFFEKVQIILENNKEGKGVGRKADYINLFAGLCRCEVCGKGVTLREKRYLVCEMGRNNSCTNRVYFPYKRLEEFVLNTAGLMGIGKMLVPENEPDEGSSIPELENKLANLRMNRRRLVERFGEGDEDAGDIADKLTGEISEVEKELA